MSESRAKRTYIRHGMSKSPEYRAWEAMRQRCNNRNHPDYGHYGARGITVCERWESSFSNFLADMGVKPDPSLSLERRNNNLGYSKQNCYYATRSEQNKNG